MTNVLVQMDLPLMSSLSSGLTRYLFILLMFMVCLSPVSNAQQLIHNQYVLTPFESQFVALREGKPIGHARLIFSQLPNKLWQLEYESKISKYFLTDKRNETTRYLQMNATDSQSLPLLPISYVYHKSGTGPDKVMSITFDHDNNQYMTSTPIDDEVLFPLNLHFDNQLFRIDVPYQLSQGKTEFNYQFINNRGQTRIYDMQVITSDTLDLPIGSVEAIKVMIRRTSSSRQTFAWFAPSLNYHLVRLQQFKNEQEQGEIQLRVHKSL